ncbi:MAG TPA: energy transducer TonB [Sphingobacteriaceae bacterium]|nr:energy transducer TonB [Sphingobacteriaceae bacterium]
MFLHWIVILWSYLPAFFYADQPVFKLGHESLTSFISRSMIYPDYSKDHCIQGTIQIGFKLDRTGKVVESRVQRGYGIDLDKEALRIVRLTSSRWIVPASFDIRTEIVLPINFSLKEFKCEEQSTDDISLAIRTYKAKEDLTKAVVNFYQKKSAGGAYNANDEERVLQLKVELGYNDKFIDRLLKKAQIELKQGDKESACEDFHMVKGLGSDKADALITKNCR